MGSLHFNFDTRWDHEPIIDAMSACEFFSLSLPKGEGRGEGSVLRFSARRFMESLHFNFDTRWDHEPIIDAKSACEFFSLSLPKGEGRGEGSVLPISARRFMERAGEKSPCCIETVEGHFVRKAMSATLQLRLMNSRDVPFAERVRAAAGWNQTAADWERFLALAPEGCFVAEWNGAPAGTATTIEYGRDLAWIGMVLVEASFQRRGIGTALLKQCLDHLQRRGVRCIKLDATPLGKKLYDTLGFRDEFGLRRWERQKSTPPPSDLLRKAEPQAVKVTGPEGFPTSYWPLSRSVTEDYLPLPEEFLELEKDLIRRRQQSLTGHSLDQLDRLAFGVSRAALRRSLAALGLVFTKIEHNGRTLGYGMVRPGSRAMYLGPIVARSSKVGCQIVEYLLSRLEGEALFWDIPDDNQAAVSLAVELGFKPQRPLTRMYLGEFVKGDSQRQFAIAGPEVG